MGKRGEKRQFVRYFSFSPFLFLPFSASAHSQSRMEEIMAVASAVTGVSRNDIISVRRYHSFIRPRFIYYWIAKKYTKLSYPQIARVLGGRDHATVVNGVRRVDRSRAEFEPYLTDALKGLKLL